MWQKGLLAVTPAQAPGHALVFCASTGHPKFSPGQGPGSAPWTRHGPNGPSSLSPGQGPGAGKRPGARTPRQPWPNGLTSFSPGQRPGVGQRPGAGTPKQPWPNGPTSLSPGQRPGWMTPIGQRPVGPRSGAMWFSVPSYRTPLGRGALTVGNPGRCPGLRNQAPLVPLKS